MRYTAIILALFFAFVVGMETGQQREQERIMVSCNVYYNFNVGEDYFLCSYDPE